MTKGTFIAWERYDRHSELMAYHFGTSLHFIYHGPKGWHLIRALSRYMTQVKETWHILCDERPEIIFVMNPPIFAVLVVFLYSLRQRARYIIHSHTAAFLSSPWSWFVWLHRLLSKKALTTIVHNKDQEKIVQRWGCRYHVLGFTPGDYSYSEDFPVNGKFNVAVIAIFSSDEPLETVFEASSRLPGVDFYVTGDYRKISQDRLSKKPGNCHLTGFLSYGQYVSLLRKADAVLDLTTRDHTILMGGFEAVSIGTPLITSDWPILKDYFSQGTVHVSNTVEGICEGVRRVQSEGDVLRLGMQQLRDRLQNEWEQKFEELESLIARG
jgi:glycosyltransferase involved in cell wall biosynthesis